MLRVILVGSGELPSSLMLGILESKHQLVGVLHYDRTKKEKIIDKIKRFFFPESYTTLIKAYKIPEINVKSINSEDFTKQALKLKPDVILVASWGQILKKNAIILPKIACMNCHPSLLPKHRGGNPFASVIRQEETKTGVTFHLVSESIDAGPILLQKELSVSDDDTGASLIMKCAYKAKEMISGLLDSIENAQLLPQKQDEAQASYFSCLTEDDAVINWNKSAQDIHNQIRALNPWMKCYTKFKNDFLFIASSKVIKLENPVTEPGKILQKSNKSLLVATGDPEKAVLVSNISVYSFIVKLWSGYSGYFINKKVKVGDYLQNI